MSKADSQRYIHSRKGSTRSVEDQVEIAHGLWDDEIVPSHEGYKANELEEQLNLDLDFQAKTSLGHLEDLGLVEEYKPKGPDTFVIASWKDEGEGEIVNGEVTEAAEEGLSSLVDHVRTIPSPTRTAAAIDGGGNDLRTVLAAQFDVVPEDVEDFLLSTSRPVEGLNDAIEAIKKTDGVETNDDYGEIQFINMPHRFRLTREAVSLYSR